MINLRHVSFDAASPVAASAPLAEKARAVAVPPPCHARAAAPEVKLDPFFEWLLATAALNPSAYRPTALQRRLSACLRSLRVKTTSEARRLLEQNPHLCGTALNAALIGVTEFFRDTGVFSALREEVVPALLRRKPGVRVLSAGCSGGHELYSMAMLLSEAGSLNSSELLGIDCRSSAISQANAGIFDTHETAAMEPRFREQYFRPNGKRWNVQATLKERTRWQVADLMTFEAKQPFDVVLYRNVAIYLAPPHADAAWDRVNAHVTPGGYLITGKAEQPPMRLGLKRLAPCIHLKPFANLIA